MTLLLLFIYIYIYIYICIYTHIHSYVCMCITCADMIRGCLNGGGQIPEPKGGGLAPVAAGAETLAEADATQALPCGLIFWKNGSREGSGKAIPKIVWFSVSVLRAFSATRAAGDPFRACVACRSRAVFSLVALLERSSTHGTVSRGSSSFVIMSCLHAPGRP